MNRPVLFRGRHFADEVIVSCARWYLRFSLSYRDLEEMMAKRNLAVDHTTVWRWVERYAPELNRRSLVAAQQSCPGKTSCPGAWRMFRACVMAACTSGSLSTPVKV